MYKHFGVMFDCSRNAVMNVDSIKRMIDYLSKMGYNTLMLYTEDTYEIKDEPYFGYLRARYSKDELKELDKYATSKNIELVPCIQTLAHLNATLRWNRFYQIRDYDDILLIDDERTYELIEKMFKTARECFSSKRINIGMDEAHMIGRGRYYDIHGNQDKNEIFIRHLSRVIEIAKKYDFSPMMWSDMFYRLATKGKYYELNPKFDAKVKQIVPKEVKLIYWDYYHQDKNVYDKMIECHKQFDNEIGFAGGAATWYGFAPQISYAIKVTKPALSSCNKYNLDEAFITCWKDNGGECSFFAAIPSLFYASEIAKGITKMSVIKQDFYEMFNVRFDDFIKFELVNRPASYDPNRFYTVSKFMLYNDPFLGIFDNTYHQGDELVYQNHYKTIKKLAKRLNEFDYLATYYSQLCKVLYYKYNLGVNTRKYYQTHEGFDSLIKQYDNAIKELAKFIEAFRNCWYKENKPHGFDVQDIRLGGLLQRLKSCKERLIKYQNKEIDKIAELEETIINSNGKDFDKDDVTTEFNNYRLTASVNDI